MPDERSAIVEIEATPHNLWHLDLASGALTLLTHEGANHRPVEAGTAASSSSAPIARHRAACFDSRPMAAARRNVS